MKKLSLLLVLAILLGAGAFAVTATPSQAQVYTYPAPPPDPYSSPWVGPGTPWVYYNGDWFLNGILYYFFGPYGWAPYYAYAPTYIVRQPDWYGPRWNIWYETRPQYWRGFVREYPYWRQHHQGERYGREFYERHHPGQGGGWEKGFHGRPPGQPHPEGRKPVPGRVVPPETHRPAPGRMAPTPEGHKPPAGRMAPEGRKPAPARVAPPAEHRPAQAPGHMAPAGKPAPAPAHVAPQQGHAPAPGRVAPRPEGKGGGAPHKPEGGAGHGEEKH
jgi:hypothetical protein